MGHTIELSSLSTIYALPRIRMLNLNGQQGKDQQEI